MSKQKNNSLLILAIILVLVTLSYKSNQGQSIFGLSGCGQQSQQSIAGIEIFLTDETDEDVKEAKLIITKIELEGSNGMQKIFEGNLPVTLRSQLIKKIAGTTIIPDNFTRIYIHFTSGEALLNNGLTKQLRIHNRIWGISVEQLAEDSQIVSFVIDLPLKETIINENGEFIFKPVKYHLQKLSRYEKRELIKSRIGEKLQHAYEMSNNTQILEVLNKFEIKYNESKIIRITNHTRNNIEKDVHGCSVTEGIVWCKEEQRCVEVDRCNTTIQARPTICTFSGDNSCTEQRCKNSGNIIPPAKAGGFCP